MICPEYQCVQCVRHDMRYTQPISYFISRRYVCLVETNKKEKKKKIHLANARNVANNLFSEVHEQSEAAVKYMSLTSHRNRKTKSLFFFARILRQIDIDFYLAFACPRLFVWRYARALPIGRRIRESQTKPATVCEHTTKIRIFPSSSSILYEKINSE